MTDWGESIRREREWIASLKVGDEVALSHQWGTPTLSKVTRTTATQIHIGHTKFRRKDGHTVGDNWSRTSLVEPTEEIRQQIEERRLRNILEDVKWRTLPLDQVKAIVAIIAPGSESV